MKIFVDSSNACNECSQKIYDRGLKASAILYPLDLWIDDDDMDAVKFIIFEIRRIKQLYDVLIKLDILESSLYLSHDDAHYQMLDIFCPLFRVVLENYFKSAYMFSNAITVINGSEKIEVNKNELNTGFNDIFSIFIDSYEKYFKKREYEIFSNMPKLDIISPNAKFGRIALYDLVKKTITNEKDHNIGVMNNISSLESVMYGVYQYCCFFAHGNMNVSLLARSELPAIPHIELFTVLDNISLWYLFKVIIIPTQNEEAIHELLKLINIILSDEEYQKRFAKLTTTS